MQDKNILESIETLEAAYLLGWLATSEVRPAGQISFITRKRSNTLEFLCGHLGAPVSSQGMKKRARLTFYAPNFIKSLWRMLGRGELRLPALSSEELTWAFLRGHFDQTGKISSLDEALSCSLSGGALFQQALQGVCPIPFVATGDALTFYGNNALDFLGKLYERGGPALSRNKKRFARWAACIPGLSHQRGSLPSFRWYKLAPEAVPPQKERVSDSGYDLTLIRHVKRVGAVDFFGTGVQVEPSYGWYFDLVPRSSLSKTGYMMAHSIGVIDRTYRGEILVPLLKIDPSAPAIELPARLVQLIPRAIVHVTFEEAELEQTARGDRGFGGALRAGELK